ncbi:MAG TPA: thioredoxin-disulfide reductase [Phycisphaerales bacterium]|nr:thioredoxin-disulfide reductase [Phycisphaerales bacterium]|tara:strand:- start:9076 stop:10065 length:990 start_codon:yes stop_codon:yes gene_type:complete
MSDQNESIEKVVIIGSGPAGWTAAIYAARANLNPLVLEGVPKTSPSIILPGGQLMLTTEVENFPGYPEGVQGPQMMEDIKKQALRFNTRIKSLDVVKTDLSQRPFTLELSDKSTIKAHSVIIATGATANWLGLENEMRLATTGGGVSACAVCDGALPVFRDQPLAVVGGGDSAMEEADYLTKFASKVYIIHRRDEFRASKIMAQRVLNNPKCEPVWNSTVVDILGDDKITALKLKNTQTGEESELPVKGCFMAIGHTPATTFLDPDQIELTPKKFLKLTSQQQSFTSVEGVFAAGDCADETYKQAITAAGMGCKAAIDAERWLADQNIH